MDPNELKIEVVKREEMLEQTNKAGQQPKDTKWKPILEQIAALPDGEALKIDPGLGDPKKVKSLGQQIKTAAKRAKMDITVRQSTDKLVLFFERKITPPPAEEK